mmetsp:Transcript_982/g.1518  ORF Transcript_982/g.1518 Transcript_982/m.1518 type:complete len:80 (+) Transcript_982:1202-1441(+)
MIYSQHLILGMLTREEEKAMGGCDLGINTWSKRLKKTFTENKSISCSCVNNKVRGQSSQSDSCDWMPIAKRSLFVLVWC